MEGTDAFCIPCPYQNAQLISQHALSDGKILEGQGLPDFGRLTPIYQSGNWPRVTQGVNGRAGVGGSPERSKLGLLLLQSPINSCERSCSDAQPSGWGESPKDKRPPFHIGYNVKSESLSAVTFTNNPGDPKIDYPNQDTFGVKRGALNIHSQMTSTKEAS